MLHDFINHPTFLLRDQIQTASTSLMRDFGFNYFQYLRCYADGSIGLLTNDTRLVEYHWNDLGDRPAVYSSFREEHQQKHAYWFLWDEELPERLLEMTREQFNICSGITFVRRYKEYYDMMAVALGVPPRSVETYVSRIKARTGLSLHRLEHVLLLTGQ